ncbi:MAG: TM2 domain-containing protein [Desulfosudaceae bacterium]
MADTDKKYQVIFYGEVQPGADIEAVKDKLAGAFKVDRSKIEGLFTGKKKVVKKNSSREVCEKTKKLFARAGAVCAVISQDETDEALPAAAADEPEKTTAEPAAGNEPAQAEATPPPPVPPSVPGGSAGISKVVLILLTLFLGGLGVHKFYLGRYLQGVLYLLFCWTGIPLIIALVELILYIIASEEALNQKYSPGSTPLVIIMAVFSPLIAAVLISAAAILIALFLLASKGEDLKTALSQMSGAAAISGQQAPTAPRPEARQAPASGTAAGKIRGYDFTVEEATVQKQNGVLHLKQGEEFFADREMIIFLFLNQESISGKTFTITPDQDAITKPHLHLRWKTGDSDTPQSDVVMDDYTMQLSFDQIRGDSVSGRIELSIPGESETYVEGKFTATLKEY